MRRNALGVIALSLVCVGIYYWIWPPGSSELEFLHGSCIKSGTVLIALWLAYPQLERLPTWLFIPCLVVPVIIAIRPRLALILIPILAVLWIIRPRHVTPKSNSRQSGSA